MAMIITGGTYRGSNMSQSAHVLLNLLNDPSLINSIIQEHEC